MIIRQFDHIEFRRMRDNLSHIYANQIRELNEYIISRYQEEYNTWVKVYRKKSVLYRLFHRKISFNTWIAGCDQIDHVFAVSKAENALPYPNLQHKVFHDSKFVVSIPLKEWETHLFKKFLGLLVYTDLNSQYYYWMNWINDVLTFSPDNRITLTKESEMTNVKNIRRFISEINDLHSYMKEFTK